MKCLIAFLALGLAASCQAVDVIQTRAPDVRVSDGKPLSILLAAGLYTGHLFPLVSLGEELVKRGHNVTLCANVMRGSTLYPEVPERVGIKFVSAGYDTLSLEEFEEVHAMFQSGFNFSVLKDNRLKNIGLSSFIQIRAKVEEIGLDNFDIIVSEFSMATVSVYFHKLGKKSIVFSTLMLSLAHLQPKWPTPLSSSGQSDDLGFVERFFNALIGSLILEPMFAGIFQSAVMVDSHYREVLQDTNVVSYLGLHIPFLYTTVFGLDFPTQRYPLEEYVGPVLMQSLPPLDQDLLEWLDAKEEKTVVYISMGTTASLTADSAQALLDGVMSTPYYALWALKAKNRNGLSAVSFGAFPNRLFLADWVPQQTVLGHSSIVMSILHCGLNGVHESLYNSLPIICVPGGYDQFEVAAKVISAGVGLSLYGFTDALRGNRIITAQDIDTSVRRIVSGDYAENAGRIRQMYKLAGGAKRAADLVEYYEDVGYEHLVPAFAKYEWGWVQYYNLDVWLVLGVMCGVLGWVVWRGGRWGLSKLCC